MFAWMKNHWIVTSFGFFVLIACIIPNPPSSQYVEKQVDPIATANLEKLIAGGVFSKYGQGEIWIGPTWAVLDFDQKQNACYYAKQVVGVSGITTGMEVKDNMNGKTIGYYSRRLELK